ncbi:sugar ABC transporter substrate-binding protein [Microbacterium sp. STN6]|uniref:ABC transporter substrate-binding protein n=1 Tax=Microbacterium sp. STN6 TaxID=2995588 RepID=UPI002260E414|nr:sugar ABC transporter substrate-binding protein [Microbacterium sp. STN6]MCX7522776.1 sugar ABC transporter substrate-binding protein [Microbacterium sp. STN6]
MKRSRFLLAVSVLTVGVLALAGCSAGGGDDDDGGGGSTTVTFRTWDENAAEAYKQSFAEFHEKNPTITVKIDVVPWSDYFTSLRTDVAGGNADDIFWINNSSYGSYASGGKLIDVDKALGAGAKKAWAPSVVAQFTQDDALWGVPQTSDGGIAVYYNKKLLADAGLSESDISHLTWSPNASGDDTLLPVSEKLTKDAAGTTADESGFDPSNITQWGYSAAEDLQAIYLPFIGSNGGTFQKADNSFTFTNPKTEQAFSYIVDLINRYHVSPGAADTNGNGDFTKDQFLQGKIALFQSGLYNLANVAGNAKFEWGVVPLPAGPAGAVSVTNGIVAAGNAHSAHLDATKKVLKWIGSKEGNQFIGATGANLPAVTAAQQTYFDYWKGQGVDVSPFFDVIKDNPTIPAPTGANFNAAGSAYKPILDEVFLGRLPVDKGLAQAQAAANKAMAG